MPSDLAVEENIDEDELLRFAEHRPYPLAHGGWWLTQTWKNLLFAHWPVPAESLRKTIAPGLELDLFEGSAWLSIVPFSIRSMRMRRTPALPYVSRCNELNVRTYVRHKEQAGVYFFSLDTDSLLSIAGARAIFRLPYFFAHMSADFDPPERTVRFGCERKIAGRAFRFTARYGPLSEKRRPASPGIEAWLVERYRLFTDIGGVIYSGEIHHLPWSLQAATVEIGENGVGGTFELPDPLRPALCHYAEHLQVLFWPPRRA